MTGAASAPTVGIGPLFQPELQEPVPWGVAVRIPRTSLATIIGPVGRPLAAPPAAMLPPEAAARAMPSCANIDMARIAAKPELAPAVGTAAELTVSFARSELDRIRTPRPTATSAMMSP
jgi:hypothetical protein